jgi:cytoskeleton protein RodZ
MRARIDVSEIEAQTKIRAKYLRALENEEWNLLPGPTFVRSFLRTYAQALGLDGKALVDEYRLRYEQPSEVEHQPMVSSPRQGRTRPSRKGGGPSRAYVIAVSVVAVVIVLLVVGLLSGKSGPAKPSTPSSDASTHGAHSPIHDATTHSSSPRPGASERVALSLRPTAAVYVCLIGDGGQKRIPGLIIQPPYTPVTYHATHFQITLGNSSVTMYVDGHAMSVPPSSKPTGYSITSSGRRLLPAGQQPTCE